MEEIWELVKEKLVQGAYVCLTIVAALLIAVAVWRLFIYLLSRSRIESAKEIYKGVGLGDPLELAARLFSGYSGSKDQYVEEALLDDGRQEIVLYLIFNFENGRTGEIRLTYVEGKLVRKQQNGIW